MRPPPRNRLFRVVMPGSSPVTHAEGTARPARPGRRRRYAARLLAGWMAFWIATAVQPCGISLAALQQENSTAVSTLDTGDHHASPNHSHNPAPAGTHCPDLAAIAAASSIAAPAATCLDSPRPAPSASDAAIMRRTTLALNPHDLVPLPPPRAPRYPRNQRLQV